MISQNIFVTKKILTYKHFQPLHKTNHIDSDLYPLEFENRPDFS